MSLQATSNYTFKQLINSNYKGKDVSLNFKCKDKCKIAALIIGGVVLLPLLGVGALLLRSAYFTLRDRKVELLNEAEALIQTEVSKQASKVSITVKPDIQNNNSEMEKEMEKAAADSIEQFNQLKKEAADSIEQFNQLQNEFADALNEFDDVDLFDEVE